MINKKYKIFVFVFLLVSTILFPSLNLAYAITTLTVTNGSPVNISNEQIYDFVVVENGGILTIESSGKLTVNGLSTAIQVAPSGQIFVEHVPKTDTEPELNGEVISNGIFNLGTITIDGSWKVFEQNLSKGNGIIFERCGSFELQSGATINQNAVLHPDGCAANITEQNNWTLEEDSLLPVEYTVEENHELILTGDTFIKGVLENKGIIRNISHVTFTGGFAELRSIGMAEIFHICQTFTDGSPGISGFFGTGAWPTVDDGHVVIPTECSKPIAIDDDIGTSFITTTEDESLDVNSSSVLDNDSDADFDPGSGTWDPKIVDFLPELTASADISSDKGGIVGMNSVGTFYYDPNGQFEHLTDGQITTDTFTYTLDDGTGGTDTAIVTIKITGVNDPPIADAKIVTTPEDTPRDITLTGSDVDSPTISFAIETEPLHGSLSGTAPNVTYTPDADYHGPDSFTFTVSDASSTSLPATITIVIISANDSPIITIIGDNPATVTVGDTYFDQSATANDTEDGDLTGSIITTGLPVDTSSVTSTTVDYSVTDASGNTTTESRTVNVVSGDSPIITITGSDPASIKVNETYVDAEATCSDTEDGDLTGSIITTGLPVDTSSVISTTVDYSCTDTSGNTTTESRTVNVVSGDSPIITITGSDPASIKVNETYVGAGDSLKEQKSEQITTLESLIDDSEKKTQKELKKSIKVIQKSLDDKLWKDDVSLESKHGNKVFDLEKYAVKSLMKIEKDDDSTDVSGVIDSLVEIDRKLASYAFDEVNTPENQDDKKSKKELEKSESELAKGDQKRDDDKFDKAIDHYKKAWKHAQKAMKHNVEDDKEQEEDSED